MIKATKRDKTVQQKKDKYPQLMISTLSGMVLVVTGEGEKGHGYDTLDGTVVSEPDDKFYRLGCVGKAWSANVFIPYEGKIILENK